MTYGPLVPLLCALVAALSVGCACLGWRVLRDRHDDVTNLLRRGAWERAAQRRVTHRGGMIVFADVDKFKEVNDEHGHPTGDLVLHGVARRLQAGAGDGALLGRYGGDEIVAWLPSEDRFDGLAGSLAERLELEAANGELGLSLRIGASFGTAVVRDGETDLRALVARANRSMRRIKRERKVIRDFTTGEFPALPIRRVPVPEAAEGGSDEQD